MKILVLSNKLPYPLKDGGAIATYNLIKGLSKNGQQITLMCFNTSKHFVNLSELPKKIFQNIELKTVNINTTLSFIKAIVNIVFSSAPYILSRFSSRKFNNELKTLLLTKEFDIVQIEGLYMLQYMAVIRSIKNIPISYRAHNIESEIWGGLAQKKKKLFKRLYLKNLTKRIYKFEQTIINTYNLILPISNANAKWFKEHGNKKSMLVFPTGFDLQKKKENTTKIIPDSLYFLGSLEWLPNEEGILWFVHNCWDKLKELHPNVKLFIAGRNANKSFIQKIDLKDIYFKGEVDDALEFIADKCLMIVPLLNGSGMRIKIIEAFKNRKPVIATSIGAQGCFATDKKNILIADKPKDFINCISTVLYNKNIQNQLIEHAEELVIKYFDNFVLSEKLKSFYTDYLLQSKFNATNN